MATGVTSQRIVGRALELAQLQAALADASGGQPSLAFVVGESGVGKSRLVAELEARATADGARVLSGECVELGEGELAFAPLVTALRPLVRDADPVLDALPDDIRAELATLLPGLVATVRGHERGAGDQARVFEALLAVLDGLARETPVLLVIEDLHWADASTRAFLALPRRPALRPSALLSSRPTGRTSCTGATRCGRCWRSWSALRALRVERHRSPATSCASSSATSSAPRPTRRSSSGCTRAARATRCSRRSSSPPGRTGAASLPPASPPRSRCGIDRLVADAQEVAPACSPPAAARRRAAAEATGLDRRALRDGAPRGGRRAHRRRHGGRYTFRHALLAEAVYDDLLPGERAELHRALAAALSGSEGPETGAQRAAAIAHHYLAAGDQPAALAAAVRAGMAAMDVQAFGEGATLFERALELWDRVPDAAGLTGTDQIDLLERAAGCHVYADDPGRAVTLARRALKLVDPEQAPRRVAWIHGLLHRSLWTLLRQDEAMEELERGLALVADDEPSPAGAARAGLLARHAKALTLQSRYHRAVREARRALDEQAALTDPDGYFVDDIGALNALGVSQMAIGALDEGAAALGRALGAGARARAPAGHRLHLGEHERRAAPRGPDRGGARGGPRRPRRARLAADAAGLAVAADRAAVVRLGRLGGRGRRARRGRAAAAHRRQLGAGDRAAAG